ncbi:MAG: hypothetical protein GY904_01450 [Planctomycetaceae bacterium]|nr:hypothetical protein [Planctomycetaceae bacterium]
MRASRRGVLMLGVCVIILLMVAVAYFFSEMMLVENVASNGAIRGQQSRLLADSGAEYVLSQFSEARVGGTPRELSSNRFADLEMPNWGEDGRGRFRLAYWNARAQKWAAGVANESAKLNLNRLPLEAKFAPEARRMLMCIPSVTPSLADAILDWLDEDDLPREFGAESNYYQSQREGGRARNRYLDELDDLLGVRNMTPELLYGEDGVSKWLSPRVGMRSNAGNSRKSTLQSEDELPLEFFLTVYGGESIFRDNGVQKTLLNKEDLPALYDELANEFGQDVAAYVVVYRMSGPQDKSLLPQASLLEDTQAATRQRATDQTQSAQRTEPNPIERESVSRGPLTISSPGIFRIHSLYDLVGVNVEHRSEQGMIQLKSPWPAEEKTYQETLPALQEKLSCVLGAPVSIQIDVNHAPDSVLRAIPGLSEELANSIIQTRKSLGIAPAINGASPARRISPGIDWLRSSGCLDLEQMRLFAPYLSPHGNAVRFVSAGITAPAAITTFCEFVLDLRYKPGRVALCRPLMGFAPSID